MFLFPSFLHDVSAANCQSNMAGFSFFFRSFPSFSFFPFQIVIRRPLFSTFFPFQNRNAFPKSISPLAVVFVSSRPAHAVGRGAAQSNTRISIELAKPEEKKEKRKKRREKEEESEKALHVHIRCIRRIKRNRCP